MWIHVEFFDVTHVEFFDASYSLESFQIKVLLLNYISIIAKTINKNYWNGYLTSPFVTILSYEWLEQEQEMNFRKKFAEFSGKFFKTKEKKYPALSIIKRIS